MLLVACTGFAVAHAQVDNVMVYGTVKDMSSSKKLDGVTVTVFKNGGKLTEVITNASGKYEVNLDYGGDYKVMCAKPGFVGKNITIDTRNVPEEERQGGHGMNIDFTMMVEIPDVDFSVLLEPFGKANYIMASGNFEWDMEYTAQMRAAQAKLLKDYEDKKKREAGADAEFAKLIAQGDASMQASDFQKAVGSFTSALGLKPKDPIATAKLSDAQMRLTEQEGTKKMAQEYAALIKEADALFLKKDYETAKTKYVAALAVKEEELHPKNKIKEIDLILADLARKAEEDRLAKELQDKYDAAVAAADAAFQKSSWDQAVDKYTEASGLKPAEKYPKDQLAAIVTKRAEEAKNAEEQRLAKELEERYQAAIKAGDDAFKASNWDQATTRYTEAGEVKPAEKYPKDQLAAIAKKREEEAKKAEEDRLARELDEKYQAAITTGDEAFKSASWDQAETAFTEAGALKPSEKYPKDRLAAILKAREDESRRAAEEAEARALQERYDAAIAAGDAAFSAEQWEQAIAKYTEASELKASEKYPKDQLAAIRSKQDELARKAEEAERQRELDARYNAAIATADKAFDKENWNDAIAAYGEASGIKPAEAYPKERIASAEARLAEAARSAEEERKRQELEARYADLISAADKAYDKESWSGAMNDYKDASLLKPEEAHPRERIAEIEKRMDAAAQAQAEEERLRREAEEKNKRYSDLINAADGAFRGKEYEKARTGYVEALEVKPDEAHPKTRIAEIESLLGELAMQAEREREAAEREREAAEREAAERARQEEEERQRNMAQAEIDAQYNAHITEADKAFADRKWDQAREKYKDAQLVKPKEAYPPERIAAIAREMENELNAQSEAERLAAERLREEEERLRREQEAAEAARLAEEQARLLAEEERLRREAEEANARLSEEEQLRAERQAARALDERYNNTIRSADEALAQSDYQVARGLYAEASDIKSQETYPLSKIEQIDKILLDLERQREEEELAARNKMESRSNDRTKSSSSVDMRKEQEAEQFMREAREREEAEKYERIKKFRSEIEQTDEENRGSADARRMQEVSEKQRLQEPGAGLYTGDQNSRVRNAEELEAYRIALAREEADRERRSGEGRDERYAEKVRLQQELTQDREQGADSRMRSAQELERRKHDLAEAGSDMAEASARRGRDARAEAVDLAQRTSAMEQERSAVLDDRRRSVEEEKRAHRTREASMVRASENSRTLTKQQLDATPRDQPRAFSDYTRSKLAMDYPAGVTEESYTEGNKVIIRRVVVEGNKADEYSKVIAKWGTFYFKNGQSITEVIWSRETER